MMDNSIGTAIAMLQAKLRLKGPAIVLNALGPGASSGERRQFMNMLSRIKRSDKGVESPTVATLEKIARGFGYATLGDFFAALGETSGSAVEKSATNFLRRSKTGDKVPHEKVRPPAMPGQTYFWAGLPHAFDPPASTVDLSTAPPFDPRTQYVLWSIVTILIKHLRASDAMAGAAVSDAPVHATTRSSQAGRPPRRAGKDSRA
jgi:hypothetical protein